MKNLYTAFLCLFSILFTFTQSQAENFSSITGNTIGSDQTICNNTTPVALTGTIPGGGTGVFTYQWQVSTTSPIAGFANIGGGTAQGYAPGALTANRWYRRIVTSGIEKDTTGAVTITVTPVITAASNVITAAQTICFNTSPAVLNGPTATGGNGTYIYQWQSSPDNLTFTDIPGANGTTYAPAALTATTWYKRVVTSGGCTSTSASIKITITPVITVGSNTITVDQSICTSQTPLPLAGSTPTGATGTYTYLWESSTTSASAGFSTAAGTSNGKNYSPLALTQSTWFRRTVSSGGCSDVSAAVLITVVTSPPGNPAVFGNGVWNVYGFSDNSFGTYAGYYTEPVLSFNTTTRFTNAQSPSYASGYQGCLIPVTNFSVSMKQTNFTPGSYQLNLNNLDDNVTIILNGTQIYTHACCVAAPINNIWTGNLGASDQMEIRWTQATGPSFLSMTFAPVTPAPLVPGTINQNLQVCYGEAPPSGFTNTTSPTSGCTITGTQWQKSIDSVTWVPIAGATALTYTETAALTQTTWYRRVTSDACNNSLATVPVKVTVNVVPPGDPTVFGNNVWNVYVFQGTGAPGPFNAAIYKGYYTEPLLSFDSRNRWNQNASPSNASGFQGCVLNVNNTWIDYKRTNFTPAIYQIDIPWHDDAVYLFINGIQVFTHNGCCDSHTNVWTGPLAATDQVEMRVSQGGGPSYEMLTLTAVTPAALTSGTITPDQTICAGDVPPTPLTQVTAPTGGCTIKNYTWEYSTDNGATWSAISGATAISYSITNSIYTQTLYRRTVNDVCGNSAVSAPVTISMNNTAPGNPAVFGNNVWNVYCFQDISYSIYAGYYTEPLLTFNTVNRYPTTSPPSTASGYLGCQLINTYYSASMKRTGFTAGLYQIDVTADDDYNLIYINGVLVSSLNYPTIQNNVWTGNLGPTDQVEIRWRNNAGPGQTGVRFTIVTATPLVPGSISAYNPNLCFNDLPIINEVTPASGGCFVNYSWQSSIDGGGTWTTISGATGNSYTATVSPTTNIQYRRVATDVCGTIAYSPPVSFVQAAGTVGNPAVFGNGVWNVYAYNAQGAAFSTAQYLGYYVEPLLSFSSLNRWGSNGSPSDASGYQGCQVDQDNHWVSYRQTNFTPGTYQIDVTTHDDDGYLFVNGVQVWTHVGCCDAHNNVWTGTLGATDKVEFRWRENFGGSNGGLNFTLVTPPTTVIAGTVAADQVICANTTPLAFTSTTDATSSCYVNYQWLSSPDNITFTDIAGATANIFSAGPVAAKTYFRRNAMNTCGVSAVSNVITVDVYPVVLTGGTIATDQTFCKGATAATLTSSSLPTGGDGNYVYLWQSSLDNIGWSNITGANTTTYASGAPTVTTYYRRKVTACGAASVAYSNVVTITVNPLTVITTQPANPTACVNQSTTISVTATGASNYVWQVNIGSGFTIITNAAPYSGANTATLTINPVPASMNGYIYRVIVSGGCLPSQTSNSVTLTVATNPVVTTQPVNTSVCVGANANFFINASGTGITYQWQQKIGAGAWTNITDGGVYGGTATSNLTLTGVTAAMNAYNYRVTMTTACAGTITSNAGVLTVVAAITNTISADQTICSGINAANLTGNTVGGYTYLWQSSTVSSSSGFVNASGTNNTSGYLPNPVSTTTYYQRIVNNGSCSGTSNVVTITLNNTPIAITAQPAAQAICAGGTAVFNATASGPGALTYQWYENGIALTDGGIYSGSLTNTLTLTGATAGMNNYTYYLRVFASGCSASFKNSANAILTTANAPVVTSSAPSFITCQGSSVQLNMTATGVGLTYQWQFNTGSGWNNLSNFGSYSNVNGNSLRINPTTASMDGYQYRCIVTGTCAPFTATTAITTMNVNNPVANNSISNSQTLCAGTPAPFNGSTPTGGTGAYTYQWFLNTGSGWFAISGATAIGYSSGPLTQTTQFLRQVTSGACASVNSTAITVTILPPTSTTDPGSTTTCAGTNATFTVVGTGSGLSYQWQVNTGSGWSNVINGASYTGVTTPTLNVIAPPFSFNGYQYRCIVNGGCVPLTVTSNPATLTVSPVAIISSQPSNVYTCEGGSATYQVTAGGTGLTYQWMEKVGAGAFVNITNGGIYSGATTATLNISAVTLAMNNNQYQCVITAGICPVNTSIASLTVNAQPSLVITNPATICAPSTVDITAAAVTAGSNLAGGILTYWNNATFTSALTNPSAISVSGTYYIRVATSPICYDIKPVVVTLTPTIINNNISSSQSICTGSTPSGLTGTAPGGGTSTYTYQWQQSTDNVTYANISGAINPNYSPGALTATTWYKRLVNSGTCSGTSGAVQITVVAYPTATISYTGNPFCATGTAAVTQSGQTGGTYSAPAGVSIDATTGTINLASSTAGTYTITYSFSNGTCAASTTTSVTINTLPFATISYTGSPYCATGTATVTRTGTAGGTFSAPAGLVIDATTGAINLSTSTLGTYLINYTFSNGTCSNSTTASITINALPTAAIAYTGSPYCATGAAAVTQSGPAGGTYSSTAGLVINGSTGAVNLVTSTPGTYTVTYSFTSGACSNTTTASITINALPTATISYAASPYCATGTATVTQTGQGGGTYTAPAGVSITAASGTINLATSTPGTYTITYSFSNGTCSNTTTTSVTINALPTAAISYNAAPYCKTGVATVTQTGQTGGTYTAPAAVSITAATGDINLAASTAGTYTITYTFSNGTCSNTTTTSITINALPVATIAYTGTPYCATGTATVTRTGQTGGTYTAPAGVSITAATGDINLATSTAGTYTITYSFSNGTCSNTATTSITIKALPTAAISYAAAPYCKTGTATVTQTGQTGGTYTAPAGVSITAATGAINLAASTAGTYTVTYSFTNAGCNNTTTTSITINPLPVATIAYAGSPYCATGTATVTQTGQTGGTYTAPAGLVINAASGDINLATSTAGTYTVTYSFTNGTCSNTATASVTITALPTATIAYAASPYCANGTAAVTRTGTAGGTYTAPAGVSITAATGAINLATSTPGTYTITYSFTAGACSNTTTTSITINALPVATIAYTATPYCKTGVATVTQTGQTGGTYTAPAGVSITAATGDINLATSTAGTYTITYTFSNGTCSNTTTTSITINALPVATISYTGSPYCATGTASVTQTGQTGGTYTAPAGVSITAATGAINLATSTPGTYTITYSFSNGTCSNTTTANITINALPTATIAYTGSPYCATGAAAVTRTGTAGGTFTAPVGVSITAATGAINLATSTPGTYTVTYSFTSGGCSNTATTSITINALPTATIAYAGSPFCATGTVSVTQTGQAGGTYTAPAGVSISAATGAINLAASTAGTYTITYSFSNGTCSNTTTTSVTITALPVATISYAASPYCATGTATVTRTGVAGGTYTAPAGVSITAATGAIDLAASTAGTYTITYTFTSGACSNTATASVTINALPTASISYSGSPYCKTGSATVTQTGQTGGTYTAPAGVSITAATGVINLTSSTAGTYTVTYTFSNGTCSNTTTTPITINALPVATIAYAGSPYCATGTASVTQTGQTGGTYTAPAGVSIAAATGAINLATSTPGTYTVTYSFSNGTCSNTATANITINALPTATIAYGGSPYCATGTATVTQTGVAGGTYSAPAGVAITAATGAINLATSTPGTYTITYSFTSGGCSNTTTNSITISALPTATIAYGGSPYCATGTATVTQTGQTGGTFTAPAGVSITAATGSINLATSTPGTYTVTYSFTNGTCANTTTTSITISALPTATIAYAASPYCATGTATVTQTGTAGGTYTAPASVSITAATGVINLATSTPGTYIITYSFTSGACSNTATTSITINALPTASISYPGSPYCATGAATVTQTGVAGGTYTAPAGLSISAANGTINLAASTPGTYTVTYSFSNGTCSNTTTTAITISALPTATIAYSGSPYCATGTASVTQTGTAGGTYTAPAGVSITAATGAINLATSTPGTYTVTYSFTSGTCANTTTTSITISALPTATIAYGGSPYCATGIATVTQTGQTGGTYSAPAGVSITAATGAINLVTSTPGTYTITYSFSNGTCSNTATTSVTINALPTATIAYAASPYCATGTATVTQTGTTGGSYTAPAGVSITAATGTINLATSTPGTYTITYSFSNGTCSNTATTSVTISALPTATITYSGSPYCATGTATVTQTGQAGGSYAAAAGVSINAATGAINLVTSTPGIYTITYSFTNGTCSNAATTSINIITAPSVVITNPAAVCSPLTVDLTASSVTTGSTAGLTYTYFTDAAATLVLSTPNAISASGTYYIKGSAGSGCSDVKPVVVTINPLPSASIAYSGSPYCATGTATVTQTGQTGGTYSAPAGVSITAATGAINLATSTPGTYAITYSFTNGTCSNTATATVTISALPTATIAYNASPYCATGTATVTQTGQTGGTYTAPAGVSIAAATGAINLATSTPGTYTITYSFTNGTCSNTATTSITINALPTATITYGGSPYCATGTATVTQTGQTGGTFTAPVGVVINAATGAINLATSIPGTYTITYSFNSGTCSNTTTSSVTINALPTATIAYTGSPYCATGTAAVTQTGTTGGTYTAPAGVSITAATGAINLATSTPGTYTITYSFTSGACSNTATANVTINALPTATIAYGGTPYCATGTATVTQTGQAGGTYTAAAGLSITSATGAINLATSTPGTYAVTYSFSNGTCSNTTTTSITINALPTATIAYAASPYCASGTASVTQTGQTGGTYTAPAGVSITAATGAINLATSTPGTYTVTYSFSNGTCSSTVTANITINALPTATITYAGSPYCANGTAAVTQTGQAGGTYSSTAGLSLNAATGAVNLTTSTPGTYTVTYSFTNGTCSNTATTSINIITTPSVVITNPTAVCSPLTIDLTAASVTTGSTVGLTFTYFTDAAATLVLSNPNAVSASGTYYVKGSAGSGCSDIKPVTVTINALPTATIAYGGSPYCATGTATVTQTGQAGGTYTAPAGVTINAATGAINLATSTPGTYTITYSFTNGTCSNTATTSVTISALPTATIAYAGSPYCASGTATVTQTGQAGGTYTASAGVSITAATGAINLATSTPGTYIITYGFSNGTCSNSVTTSVTINALPTATITYAASPYCATGIATVTQTGQGGGTYSAPAGVSITAATGAINLATSTPGTYTVTYSFSNGTCSNTATTSITISALPTATIAYAGSPYCATGTATVTQTGQTGGTYTAPAGVSITAATGAINLATSTPGTYTVTYSFTSGTCANATTTSITISALPTATIAYAASPYCATGTATVTQTGTTGGTYTAPAGVSITAATGAINLATSTPGTYTVTYSFSNGTCSSTATANITINALPTATIAYTASPYCATGTASVTQTGQAGGTFTAPAGVSITAATGAINLATSTAGTYSITYSFSNGTCSNTATASITINALPTATIAYAGSPYCATGTASVTQTGQAGGTYSAPAGVSITAATGAINLATSTPGTYTITYSFTNGTCSNSSITSITINALPTATIAYTGSPYCATGTASVTQTGIAGGTYSSTAGLSLNTTTGDVNLSASTPGIYTVTYSFTGGACGNTTTASINIVNSPSVVITNPAAICTPSTVDLTAATVTTGSTAGLTYTYYTDAAATSILSNPNAVATSGTYYIKGSAGSGCSDIKPVIVTVNATPTVVITNPAAICSPGTVDITTTATTTGSTAGLTYTYFTDAAATIVLSNPNAVSASGTFYIKGTNGSGCTDVKPVVVTINALPTATIAYSGTPYCATGTANVTQTGQAGGTYSAPAGVSITAATGAINLATSTPGTYTITYSFSNGTCSNNTTTSITINALPTATIAYSASPYCATGSASVTQTGTGGGTYSAPAGVSIIPATGVINLATSTPGTYIITYSFSNGACSNTTTTSITINALPTATIAYAGTPYCATGTAAVTQTGQAGGTYIAPAGISINAATGAINLATSTPGTYTVTYSFTNGTCGNTTTTNVTISALPTATIAYAGSPYCATGTATATQTGQTGGTYSAPAGVSINASTGAINLATSTPGTYTITYSFSNGTCSNTTTTSVTINALPTATITYAASPYCATGTATVTQTGQTGGTYTAPAGVSITAATGAINLATSTPGTYTVTYGFTNGTCNSTATASITINALPMATIAYAGSPYCATSTASVTQTGQAGGTYSAPAGVSITAATGDINLALSTPGTYTITYNFSNGTCSNSVTTSITINALPTATIAYAANPYCATGTATVTQTGQAGGNYSAPAGVTIAAATGTIDLATSIAGTYTITYSFTNGTCSNTTTTSITINALPFATISYAGSPYCASGLATATQTGQAGGTYSAPAGVVINASTGEINLVTTSPGTYTVTYSFSNGTCSNTTTASVTINTLPTATIAYAANPYCATGTATVTQTGQTGGVFTAPAGVVINAATGSVDLAASTAGTYTITYAYGNGICSSSTTTSITINALPTATIVYTGSPYCASGTATVTQTGQAGGTYTAPAGVSINASTGAIDLGTSTPGTYIITYSFSNGTCSNTTTTSVTISTLPTAVIAYGASPYCATGTATVTQTGQTGGTYTAPAGVTINAATGAIDLALSTPGTYTVTYTFSNGTCSNTTTTSITINALPTATIVYAANPYCATGTATVTQTGVTGGSYSAPAGIVVNASTGDINLVSSSPGTYTITYSFSNGTCSNTTTTTITINALPTATAAYTVSPYCATGTATATVTGQTGGTFTAPAGISINGATGDIDLGSSTPGTYTITYNFTNGVCSNTTTTSITINALPTAAIAYAGSPYCAISTGTVTQTGQTGGTYTAPAGVVINALTGDINLSTSTTGTYTITYTFTNGTCSNTTTTSVTINALPTATIAYVASPYCATGTAIATLSGPAGGTYISTAGLSLDAVSGDIDLAASTPGTYIITYSFSNGTCSNSTTTTVTINALPTATIAYAASPYCATGIANATSTGQTGGTYTAPAGINIDAVTGDIDLATSTPGTYTVTYTFSNGTCSNTTTAAITINALPTATIAYTALPYCATGTAVVTQGGQAGGTYSAAAGLAINAATGDIDLASSTAGTYAVTYSFTNGTCSNTSTTSITINALPTATIAYTGTPYCPTGTATVTRTGQAGGTFSAAAGLIINAVSGDIDLAGSTPGTYTITYTFTNGTCGNTTTTSVIITALPVIVITDPAPVCAPSTVDITAAAVTAGSASGLTFTYFQDAAATIVLSNPNALNASGTYYIKGTAASGCSDIQPVLVTINPKPTVVITNPTAICAPGTVDITTAAVTAGSTAALTYTYFTDAAGTTPLSAPNAVSASGTYYIQGTTASGCSDIQPVVVTINALPLATIDYSGTPYCTTGTATVTQTGQTGGFYTAPAAVSIDGITGNINLAASTPGTYTITYTFSNGTCSNAATALITINPKPTVVTNNPAAVCVPFTVNLTTAAVTAGSTPGLTYTYYKDAAGTIVLTNPASVITGGTYYIRGTNGTGCTDIKPVVVTINPLPVATIAYTGTPYCANGTAYVSLTGTGAGTYVSSPGLSLNPTTGDINLSASTEGTYLVVYSFTNGTCSNSVSTSVTIKNPALVINNPPANCSPGTVDLTNPSVTAGSQAGLTYNYYQDNAGTIPVVNPAAVGTAGTYFVKGIDMSTGCSSNIQPVLVTIHAKPVVTASASSTDICKGTTITLTAVSPGNTIEWLGVGAGDVVTVTPSDSVTYFAVATSPDGCMDTTSVDVAVKPFRLTLTANPDPVLAGTTTTLTTTGNFTYNVLSWSPDVFFADQTALTQTIVVKDTSKSFTVIAQSTDGCTDTATLYVVVDPNLKDFFVPNSFSPNGDGNNDIFKVYGSSVRDVTMRVYNQWGELIFESQNVSNGWDGTWKGRPQAVGVYVYVTKVTFYNNVSIMKKGTVNLIR